MITPSFGLTATERILPKLALDFTTATLDARITFTRAGNTATYTNSSGVITAINANLPRFDYNPSTLICQGLLIEEARTNIVLNSLIDGTILSTQIVTTSATAYTLSFYGTGSIVLTGTHSATVTGTGVYPSRKTYTFTPTAGALTLTVSGTVQYAQLEAGSFATSFIPTNATVGGITRNADVATMTGTNFSSWYVQGNGSLKAVADSLGTTSAIQFIVEITNNTRADAFAMGKYTTGAFIFQAIGATGSGFTTLYGNFTTGVTHTMSLGMGLNSSASNYDAADLRTGATPTVLPIPSQMGIGGTSDGGSSAKWNGHIKLIEYWPQRLINNEVTAFSK